MEVDQTQPSATKVQAQPPRGRALGRGLEALLPSAPPPSVAPPEAIRRIPLSQIDPNPYQTRHHFDPERLKELAESIKLHGVMQPVVLRTNGERFMLIAGERRWRASALAGLPTIPAILREVPDSEVLELTLIENIQREDLNPIETAEAFARLSSAAGLTHDQIAVRTGKDRATVTNFLRLLKLPEQVREQVGSGELSMGHAKSILTLPTEVAQMAFATRIIKEGLSVRQTEALVKPSAFPKGNPLKEIQKEALADPNVQAAIQELERVLGTRVRLVGDDLAGKIIIEYYSSEDLDRIYNTIVGR